LALHGPLEAIQEALIARQPQVRVRLLDANLGQRKVRAGPPDIFNSRSLAVHSDSIPTTPFSPEGVVVGGSPRIYAEKNSSFDRAL
jgi:hypothetical protein